MKVVYLIGILPFMFSCSHNILASSKDANINQNAYIDYVTFKGSSYNLNKTKKIELLAKDSVAHYVNKFNVPSEIANVYKNWYLVTGATQPNGGWYYQASIKSRNILLCLIAPDPFIPQLTVLKVPLLLVGDVNNASLLFDEACVR